MSPSAHTQQGENMLFVMIEELENWSGPHHPRFMRSNLNCIADVVSAITPNGYRPGHLTLKGRGVYWYCEPNRIAITILDAELLPEL